MVSAAPQNGNPGSERCADLESRHYIETVQRANKRSPPPRLYLVERCGYQKGGLGVGHFVTDEPVGCHARAAAVTTVASRTNKS